VPYALPIRSGTYSLCRRSWFDADALLRRLPVRTSETPTFDRHLLCPSTANFPVDIVFS
jgi:hypothetical protein